MRVGLCIGRNRIGGAERQVSLLAQGLVQAGIPVTVYFRGSPIEFKKTARLDFGAARCVHLWNTRSTKRLADRYFAYHLMRSKISVLHMFTTEAMEYSLPAARLAQTPRTVGSVRGILFSQNGAVRDRLMSVSREVDYITSNCQAIQNLLLDLDVCGPEKLRVINNGIALRLVGERKFRGDDGAFNVIFVGTLKDVKDPLTFVRSALLALEQNPNFRFLIAGDGPLRAAIEDLINNSRWSKRFSLLGAMPPEAIPYHHVQLLVSTSRREGSSNAILEALSHGLPAVGTAVGGTIELLKDRSFGCLVEPGDARALAQAMQQFYDKDENTMRHISKDALAFIRDGYSVSRMVENHIGFYREILGK